jgi:hypothetical protein
MAAQLDMERVRRKRMGAGRKDVFSESLWLGNLVD